jgi:hypothetical protein
MANLKSILKIIGILLVATAATTCAHAGIITATASVASPGCQNTNPNGVNVSCPSATVFGVLGDFSGFVTLGGRCGETPDFFCSASFTLDGEYYFAGVGTQSFTLGQFHADAFTNAFGTLRIDGVPYFANGPAVDVQNLQLGMVHELNLNVQIFGETGSYSYDFTTPGIVGLGIVPPPPAPEPGSGWLVLFAIPGCILFHCLGLRLKNGRKPHYF